MEAGVEEMVGISRMSVGMRAAEGEGGGEGERVGKREREREKRKKRGVRTELTRVVMTVEWTGDRSIGTGVGDDEDGQIPWVLSWC